MKNEIVANSCRVCLTKTKKLRSLYKPMDEGDEPPNKMLYLITGIEVEKMDEHEKLPKSICKNCELSLNMAFEFRENALKTQQIIDEYLKELHENASSEINKSSVSMFKSEYEEILNLDCVDAIEDIHNLSNDQHKYSLEVEDELNETIQGEDDSQERNQIEDEFYNQQDTSYIVDSYREDNDEESTNENYFDHQQENGDDEHCNGESEWAIGNDEEAGYTEQTIEIMPAEEDNYTCNQKNLTKSMDVKTVKKKITRSTKLIKPKGKLSGINLTEKNKLIPRRGRKPSININQNGYICDICGNVFAKRGRMMEHRQRHDKECRFCCEICGNKYLTRELLRKHMFSHCGGKPLKCEFCSRTFYYESVRKAHEAVHKGIRPYICDACGKGFSYPHALKKHKLIHAEIKLYRCEYCNKDFRLQHHMKQHEHTKLHQNTVRFAKSGNISFGDSRKIIREDLHEDILFIEEIEDDELATVGS